MNSLSPGWLRRTFSAHSSARPHNAVFTRNTAADFHAELQDVAAQLPNRFQFSRNRIVIQNQRFQSRRTGFGLCDVYRLKSAAADHLELSTSSFRPSAAFELLACYRTLKISILLDKIRTNLVTQDWDYRIKDIFLILILIF
jgi:hypothetical protein